MAPVEPTRHPCGHTLGLFGLLVLGQDNPGAAGHQQHGDRGGDDELQRHGHTSSSERGFTAFDLIAAPVIPEMNLSRNRL